MMHSACWFTFMLIHLLAMDVDQFRVAKGKSAKVGQAKPSGNLKCDSWRRRVTAPCTRFGGALTAMRATSSQG